MTDPTNDPTNDPTSEPPPPTTWHSAGPCPFLTCLETGPHEHAICPDCGAVRYGNPFYCRTCNTVLNAERAAHHLEPVPLWVEPEGTP